MVDSQKYAFNPVPATIPALPPTYDGTLIPGHLAAKLVPNAMLALVLRATVVQHRITQNLDAMLLKGLHTPAATAANTAVWSACAQTAASLRGAPPALTGCGE